MQEFHKVLMLKFLYQAFSQATFDIYSLEYHFSFRLKASTKRHFFYKKRFSLNMRQV